MGTPSRTRTLAGESSRVPLRRSKRAGLPPRGKHSWLHSRKRTVQFILALTLAIVLQFLFLFKTRFFRLEAYCETKTPTPQIFGIPLAVLCQASFPTPILGYIPYHRLVAQLEQNNTYDEYDSYSAFSRAKKKDVPNRQLCRDSCCVQAVAISLDQDAHKIVNAEDAKDLADVWIRHHPKYPKHLRYHATTFHQDMIPCFLPGTIIQIDNHRLAVRYFWTTVRPKIKVPFVLITTGTSDNSPSIYQEYLADPLLIKWYGTNPRRKMPDYYPHKLRPMHLGLIGVTFQYQQNKYLKPYLEANNYINPFAHMDRFDLTKYPLDWDKDVLVNFDLGEDHQRNLWKMLCPQVSNTSVSCNQKAKDMKTPYFYAGMSQYRFGISPTGQGWDCHRTYELLLLGVIPIIQERIPDGRELFRDLPVIHMPNLDKAPSKAEIIETIETYIRSPHFANTSFTAGWERLFTKHQRQQLLQDTGRDKEMLANMNGQVFYQAYRYTTTSPQFDGFCEDKDSCPYVESRDLTTWKIPELGKVDEEWLNSWHNLDVMNASFLMPTQRVSRPGPRPPKPTNYITYNKLAAQIDQMVADTEGYSYSAYSRATKKVVPNRRLCREKCCAEVVAISLDQDTGKIVNAEDGKDLADIRISHYHRVEPHLPYHAALFSEDMVPCMLPGTIIQVDNHKLDVLYFWTTVRPKIKVPFVLVTTGLDDDTPAVYEDYLADPLLIKWYGTNPHRKKPSKYHKKLQPMHLGLSYQHPQSKYLKPYLEINSYANPFANMDRFDLTRYPLDWDKDVLVHFGLSRAHRRNLWKMLCPQVSDRTVSCNQKTKDLKITTFYGGMCQYRFGISPSGQGWDTHRTYEMLLLGVIPIIQERIPDSHELFQGLPVIHMPNLDEAESKEEILETIDSYMQGPQFKNRSFTSGWERLFTKHQRRQLLRDTGRDKNILTNNEGHEFYQAFRYTTTSPHQDVFCADKGSCPYAKSPDLTPWKIPELGKLDEEWLMSWRVMDDLPHLNNPWLDSPNPP